MTASKIENIKMKQSQETRVALLEQSILHINENLLRMERKIDQRFDELDKKIDQRFDSVFRQFGTVDEKFSELERKLDKFDSRLWSNFYWMLSTMFTLACAGAAVCAKGFGWLD